MENFPLEFTRNICGKQILIGSFHACIIYRTIGEAENLQWWRERARTFFRQLLAAQAFQGWFLYGWFLPAQDSMGRVHQKHCQTV